MATRVAVESFVRRGQAAQKAVDAIIKNTAEKPVAQEILAESIVAVAKAASVLLSGPLKRRAIFVLIRDATSHTVSLNDIEKVLDAAADLQRRYVK